MKRPARIAPANHVAQAIVNRNPIELKASTSRSRVQEFSASSRLPLKLMAMFPQMRLGKQIKNLNRLYNRTKIRQERFRCRKAVSAKKIEANRN
jgi:hypothetical protein